MHWEQLGLEPSASAAVRDLYREENLGEFTGAFTATVRVHDVVALRVTAPGAQSPPSWRPWAAQPLFAYYPEDDADAAEVPLRDREL